MSIFIRPGGHALQKHQRNNGGFTLPEVLVSLLLSVFLVQIICQWGVLTIRSQQRIEENQFAVYLAQAVLAETEPEISEGWRISVEEIPLGNTLQEQEITVQYENQEWHFYYAGTSEGESI